MALQWHSNGTSVALQSHFDSKGGDRDGIIQGWPALTSLSALSRLARRPPASALGSQVVAVRCFTKADLLVRRNHPCPFSHSCLILFSFLSIIFSILGGLDVAGGRWRLGKFSGALQARSLGNWRYFLK